MWAPPPFPRPGLCEARHQQRAVSGHHGLAPRAFTPPPCGRSLPSTCSPTAKDPGKFQVPLLLSCPSGSGPSLLPTMQPFVLSNKLEIVRYSQLSDCEPLKYIMQVEWKFSPSDLAASTNWPKPAHASWIQFQRERDRETPEPSTLMRTARELEKASRERFWKKEPASETRRVEF